MKLHHSKLSPHFPERYLEFTFLERKAEILKKSEDGNLRIEVVKNEDQLVGYCISSISHSTGEIDSIYLEEEYRSYGIGKTLTERTLNWMEENNVENKKIVVAVGNEDLLKFYKNYDFFPRHLILEQK